MYVVKYSLPSRVEQSANPAVGSGRTAAVAAELKEDLRNRKEPRQRATKPLLNPTATSKYEIYRETKQEDLNLSLSSIA